MRMIGLLGGMSWESSTIYYQLINQHIRERLGGHHSASIALISLDFAEIAELQRLGDWNSATVRLIEAARRVAAAGAECLLICTNTMHKVAGEVAAAIPIPLLHIADVTGERLRKAGVQKIGLLGTKFTMEQDFYRGRLLAQGFSVLIPEPDDRELVHTVIYDQLCKGIVLDSSRVKYMDIIEKLVAGGAEGIILGCTEIGMLIDQSMCKIPLFDTTRIHAESAVEFALGTVDAN